MNYFDLDEKPPEVKSTLGNARLWSHVPADSLPQIAWPAHLAAPDLTIHHETEAYLREETDR